MEVRGRKRWVVSSGGSQNTYITKYNNLTPQLDTNCLRYTPDVFLGLLKNAIKCKGKMFS